MVDYIRSETIKKYYKENGIVLSDRMIAARICNARFSVEEVHSSLQEIQERTEDVDLKEQIKKYISRETAMYEKMKTSVSRDIYKLSVLYENDDDYCDKGYFSDFDAAFRVGREMQEKKDDVNKFQIEKFHLMEQNQLPFKGGYWEMGCADGCAGYGRNGKLYNMEARMEEDEEEEITFADEYFSYPHPFKRGDILVRHGDDEMLYIMDMDAEAVARRDKKGFQWGDVTDIGIAGTMINRRTGRIWGMDEWINPLEFEYASIDEKTEDVIEQAALEMRWILLGKTGSFQYIFDACARRQEEYLESTRISLITGIELHPHNVLF